MEIVIVTVIVAVALLCPVTMFGPGVLHRLGLRKRPSSAASCIQMSRGADTASIHARLLDKRDVLDREIADLEASLGEAGAEIRMATHPAND